MMSQGGVAVEGIPHTSANRLRELPGGDFGEPAALAAG
jgi:hypothetical protein